LAIRLGINRREGSKKMTIEQPVAGFKQVAAILRREIRSGVYEPGSLMPSEPELVARFKVSRSVINRALSLLHSEGLVRPERGRGTTVNPIPVIPRNAVVRQSQQVREGGDARGAFDGELRNLGLTPKVEVTVEQITANAEIAELLGVEEGADVLARKRVMYANDIPVQLATSYIPWAIAEGTRLTEKDTGPGGTYSRLAELGHKPKRANERTRERAPEDAEAAGLRMDASQRVFHITRTVWDAAGQVVEVTESVLPAYQWEFQADWEME
jgi:GntR family transcriptional regulator